MSMERLKNMFRKRKENESTSLECVVHSHRPDSDQPVIKTADDAILAKLSTSQYGYYDDPFLPHMALHAHGLTSCSKSTQNQTRHQHPIIRKGTHARVCVMDRCITAFVSLKKNQPKQIVILGAGKDTAFLRYQAGLLNAQQNPLNTMDEDINSQVQWYEIDHPSVIQSKKNLIDTMPSITDSKNLSSLHLVPFDLRSSPHTLFDLLVEQFSFSLNAPTLFVLECVQMYLPETSSKHLLSTISQVCKTSIIAIYDPLASNHSPFGKTMQKNLLASKAITTESSMMVNTTLTQQVQKLCDCNFDVAIGCNMFDAYETILDKEQRWKANMKEMLDEFEEWELIMRHYCLVVGACSDHSDREGKEIIDAMCQMGINSAMGFMPGKCEIVKK